MMGHRYRNEEPMIEIQPIELSPDHLELARLLQDPIALEAMDKVCGLLLGMPPKSVSAAGRADENRNASRIDASA
jgi:hypothetical protein